MTQVYTDEQYCRDIVRVAKKLGVCIAELTYQTYANNGEYNVRSVERRFGSWKEARAAAAKSMSKADKAKDKELAETKDRAASVLKIFATLSKGLQRQVTLADLASAGVTENEVRRIGTMTYLEQQARSAFPDMFYDISLSALIQPRHLKKLRETVKHCSRFVITTAVTGCPVHAEFYTALKSYCNQTGAALLILTASDPAHNRDVHGNMGTIDAKLASEIIVGEDTAINNNLFLSTIKLSAKQIDPTTGLSRIGQRDGSFIYASPKQRLTYTPVSNNKLPHALMTTGAITSSRYTTNYYMSERTAYIAEHDHVLGAIIVDVIDDEVFHFRQIQANPVNGSFSDLGWRWTAEGDCVKAVVEAFVMGDWHSGETDPIVRECWEDAVKVLHPKRVVLHDVFNGHSINHHEAEKSITRGIRAQDNMINLYQEIEQVAVDIDFWAKLAEEVVIVKSNHDEFYDKYIQSGMYINDPQNLRVSLMAAIAMLDGIDPLEFCVKLIKAPSGNVRWLKRDEDYKVARIQLGAHGDLGPNGAKGNTAAIERSYGSSVTAHGHTPEILRGAWVVGTSSYLKLTYNRGPSSWMHTSCIVHDDGSRQLINVINGRWRADAG